MTFKNNGKLILIFNEEGWVYAYQEGVLISVESPTGRALNFIYNKGDLLRLEMTDPDGIAKPMVLVACQYDDKHRMVSMEIGRQQHRFAYNKEGLLEGWDKPNGESLNFYYDKIGLLNEIEPARLGKDGKLMPTGKSQKLVCQYMEPKEVKKEGGDPKKNPANYFIQDDGTYRYSYTYHPKGWSKGGGSTPYYDVTATDDLGVSRSMRVDFQDNIFSSVNPYGKETKAVYYPLGGIPYGGKIRKLYQDGELQLEYRYDKKTGWLTQTMDKNGVSTFYQYQKDGKVVPLFQGKYGQTIKTIAFDPKPIRILRGTDLRNAEIVAKMEYDACGRLIARTDAEGNRTTFSYDKFGDLQSITTPDAAPVSFKYDAFGRVAELTQGSTDPDAKPQHMQVQYDEYGQVSKQIAPDGNETSFVYDDLGQVKEVYRNKELVTAYERDANGEVIGQKDGAKRERKLQRDAKGNIIAEIQPGGITSRYEYDEHNRRTAQIDANGNKITFSYDKYGHLIEQKNPLGQTLTWTYNKDGKLEKRSNGVQQVSYRYDEEGRLWLIDYGANGQLVRYTYNQKGLVMREETPTFLVENAYDYQNRLVSKRMVDLRQKLQDVKDGRLREHVLRYKYNSRGQKTQVILCEAAISGKDGEDQPNYEILQQTDYQYNSQGKLTALQANGQSVFTQKYDAQGRLSVRNYGNAMRADYRYDPMGRLAKIEFSGSPLASGQKLALEYNWSAGNELISRSWNGQTQYFGYDAAGRLTGVFADKEKKQALEAYQYDAAGNITTKMVHGEQATMNYNAANQLLAMNGNGRQVRYSYDVAGRLTETDDNATGKTSNRYGWLDKTIALQRQGQAQNAAIALDYYPDGQLAVKGVIDSSLLALSGTAQAQTMTAAKDPDSAFNRILKALHIKSTDEALMASPLQTGMKVYDVYVWDGLGLLRRNGEVFGIEPHISGGAPVYVSRVGDFQGGRYLLNDMLGTTLAEVDGNRIRFNNLSAFGLPVKQGVETPKPEVAAPKADL